jgi:Zn-dependent protease with chaperone function
VIFQKDDIRGGDGPVLGKLKLLGILLAIPLLGYLALGWVGSKQEREWHQALEQTIKNVPADRLDIYSLREACSSAELAAKLDDVCSAFSNVRKIQALALWAGVASLLFPLLVMLAGAVCKTNRNLLLHIFAPGLYISNLVVSVLVLVQGTVLTGTIYYGEPALLGRIHYIYILLFGFSALAGAFYIIRATFGLVKRAKALVVGHSLKVGEYPQLWQFVNGLAKTTGTEPPHNLVVGLTPNLFVTEADVQCLDGELMGRTMYISAPLCRILTSEQLSGVIAHELGHFIGADTKFSLKFYPIYRGALDSLHAVAQAAADSELAAIALTPAIYMLAFFLECFSGAENKISREREIAADAVAAEAVGAANVATALAKIAAFTGMWENLTAVMQASLQKGTITFHEKEYDAQRFFSNVSSVFVYMVANNAEPIALEGLDAKIIPHPTDSHPPLSVRLAALKTTLAEVGPDALNVSPDPASSAVIDKLEELEMQLSVVQQLLLNPDQRQRFLEPSADNGIRACPSCGTSVLPADDGKCPACQTSMAR